MMAGEFKHKIIRGLEALDDGKVVATISTCTVDRDGEVILPSAWEKRLDSYLSNPVVLWAHSHFDPPVGKMVDYEITDKAFRAVTQFATEEYDFARLVYSLYKGGYLNAFSVGFIPYASTDEKEDENQTGVTYTDVELIEYSAVPVPSNREALIEIYPKIKSHLDPTLLNLYEQLVEESKTMPFDGYEHLDLETGDEPIRIYVPKGFKGNLKLEELPETKGATPYADLPVDEESDWNADEAEQRVREWATADDDEIDWQRYRQAFFWYDPENADEFGGYKLPFADVQGGRLVAIWRGVVAAMAALNGARGGVDIPEEDRQAVYNHIVRYYEKVGREPPPLKAPGETEESYDSLSLKEIAEALRDAAEAMRAMADAFLEKATTLFFEEQKEESTESENEDSHQRMLGEIEAMIAKLQNIGGN